MPTESRHSRLNRIFGANMTRARDLAGLSKRATAKGLGVDPKTITRWERGIVEPLPNTRVEIASFLGQPLSFFYDETVLDEEPAGALA